MDPGCKKITSCSSYSQIHGAIKLVWLSELTFELRSHVPSGLSHLTQVSSLTLKMLNSRIIERC